MKCIEKRGEVEVTGVSDFDLARIFECGQCFRWNADVNGIYTGVVKSRVARVRRMGGSVFISGTMEDFELLWRDYFDLNRDYGEIRRQLCIDDFMREATAYGAGIRILRQDKWEALCSFIISQNNNIPRIKGIVGALCELYGDSFEFEGCEYHAFPTAERLAELETKGLAPIRCGYRADYILGAAREVASGKLDLESLANASPSVARATLKTLHGIGDKVAECAVLFGLGMLNAFPLDIWMKRAIAEHYGQGFDPEIFSPYAGIAQQYIFYYMRSTASRKRSFAQGS